MSLNWVIPDGPVGPVGPVAPVAPVAPWIPWGPAGPWGPCGPWPDWPVPPCTILSLLLVTQSKTLSFLLSYPSPTFPLPNEIALKYLSSAAAAPWPLLPRLISPLFSPLILILLLLHFILFIKSLYFDL